MSSELTILALMGVLTVVSIMIQVLLAMPQLGIGYLAGPRDGDNALTGMAARAERAMNNTVIALTIFAPAILLLDAKSAFDGTTLLAAQIFLVARVVYLPIYIMGIPWLRTIVWIVGLLATLCLYCEAF